MKKDTFYFSHDYNAHNDYKILFLRQQLGMEGYGIYWVLVESLANSGGQLPLKIVPVLAMQMQVPDVKVMAVIQNFELFEIFDNSFCSNRLNIHLDARKTISEQAKRAQKIGEEKRLATLLLSNNLSDLPTTLAPLMHHDRGTNVVTIVPRNNHDCATKERKGKEKKEKYIGGQAPTPEQEDFFKNFENWIITDASNVAKMKEPFSIDQYLKIKENFTTKQIKDYVLKMHNYALLLKKNISAYLTFLNWTKNNFGIKNEEQLPQNANINDQLKATKNSAAA